jgi:hypothetical protein
MVLGTTSLKQEITLDVEALIGSHLLIQANAGGGKSRTIRKIMEIADGKAQRIILDVEDEFHTLREISPGMVVLGPEGDAPANLANAAMLPNFLLETGLDAVLQINQLGLEGRREFIARFLHALIGAPRHLWHPALVVLDETHRYAPQAGKEVSSDPVAALASEGRKRGFTAIFATQRMAKIDKDATGDVNNWLMGRAGQSTDRDRCADELGLKKTSPEMRALGKLNPGNFWVIGPALTAEATLVHVGNVQSTHLRSGQRGVPVPPGDKALKAMMAKLHVEEPKPAPATSLSAPTNVTPESYAASKDDLAAEYRRGYGEGDAAGFSRAVAIIETNRAGALRALAAQQSNATAALEYMQDLTIDLQNAAPASLPAPAPKIAPVAEGNTRPVLKPNGGSAGSSPAGGTKQPVEQRVLNALAELEAMKVTAPTREIVAFMCDYSNTTSTGFARAMAALNKDGLVSAGGGQLMLTDAGRRRAQPPPKRTPTELRARIVEMIGGKAGQVMGALVKSYPQAVTREALAAAAGYTNTTSTGFAQAMAKLSALNFVEYPEKGQVVAARLLFQGA